MITTTGTYFDGQVSRGRPVALEFAGDVVRITGDAIAEEVSLDQLRVSARLGDVPRYLYLPRDTVVETPDNGAIDAALAGRQHSRGAQLIHALESRQWIAVVGCFILLAAIVAAGYYGPPALARAVVRRVPVEVDQRIGAAALAAMRPYFTNSQLSAPERARVENQLTRVRGNSTAPRPRVEYRAMNAGLANAFALPGNVIVVTDQLVRLPATDDELAAVLAHELGHLEKRHGLQGLLRNSFAVLIVAAVTGDVSALTSFAGSIPLTILTAGYSRDLEREADRYALELLRARGITPRAFSTVLVKLEASVPVKLNSTYLSTHPATDERTKLFGGLTEIERKAVLLEPVLDRARDEVRRRDYTSALTNLDRVLKDAPTAAAYVLRARVHLGRNESLLAEADLAKAESLDPKLVEAWVVEAEYLALSARKFDGAIGAAQKAAAIDPASGSAALFLGYAEMMSGDLAAASPQLARAVELVPTDYRSWAYRGLLEARKGDFAAALTDYNRALRIDPSQQWVHYDRGVAHLRQREYTDALTDFAAVTASNLQSADYYYDRGIAEQALGKRDLAVADYTRALAKHPAQLLAAHVHSNRAAAYAADRNYRAAVLDYDAAIEADPRNGPLYLRRAAARRRADDARGAVTDLDRATELGVDRKLVTRERAEADWDLGRYDEAVAGYTALLAQSPAAPVYECRGLIEFSLGEYDKAAQDFSAYFKTAKAHSADYVEFFRLLNRRAQKSADQEEPFLTTIATWPDGWPKSIGRYLAGQITEGRLLDEANGSPADVRDERLCEAYGYIGLTYLLAGNTPTAEEFLQKCVRTGVITFYEYRIARAELRRMHATY